MSDRSKKRGDSTVPRDPAQFGPLIARRYRLLTSAGDAFDAGDEDHIVVVASVLRLLLTDRLIDRVMPLKRTRFTDTVEHPGEEDAIGGYGFGLTRILGKRT